MNMKHVLILIGALAIVAVGGVVVAQSTGNQANQPAADERTQRGADDTPATDPATTTPPDSSERNEQRSTSSPGEAAQSSECQADVAAMQQAVEEQDQMCTMQIAEMQCPHNTSFTHTARDGCEIGELKERGWTRAAPQQAQ
jgi:hypothetical protein